MDAIDRNACPPGYSSVVEKLKKKGDVDNPHAVAWSMKDEEDKKEKHASTMAVTTIAPHQNLFRRNLTTLAYLARSPANASATQAIPRLYSDAMAGLAVLYRDEGNPNFFQLWKFILDETKGEAEANQVRRMHEPLGNDRYEAPIQSGAKPYPKQTKRQLPDPDVMAIRSDFTKQRVAAGASMAKTGVSLGRAARGLTAAEEEMKKKNCEPACTKKE